MKTEVVEKISFVELAKRVVEKVGKPMTAGEIWEYAQQTGLASLLNSTGKTPEASLGALLYTNVQKAFSISEAWLSARKVPAEIARRRCPEPRTGSGVAACR